MESLPNPAVTQSPVRQHRKGALKGPMLEATRALALADLGAFGFVKPTIRYSRRIGPKRATP